MVINHIHWMVITVQDGTSPLYVASQQDHADVVDALLSSGADPNLAVMV